MAKSSSKKQRTPQPKIDNVNSAELESIEDKPIRYVIAAVPLLIIGLFYNLIELFQANNLNDFSEYYLRARDWADGKFVPTDADFLLSVVEYFGILAHPNDFLASYHVATRILIGIVILAAFVFVVRRNDALPDFWTKMGMVVVTLSIPHFLLTTVTLDQSLLFAACLLLWLSTYDIPWAGAVGFLVFFSRKEGVIVIPLYILMYVINREQRKQIAINATTFLLLLIGMKYWVVSATEPTSVTSAAATAVSGQEYEFLGKLSWAWLKGLFSHIATIPVLIVTYAYEALQSTVLFTLFIVGLVFSARRKTSWALYGVILAYMLAFAVNVADQEAAKYTHFTSLIGKMSKERDYFIVNAFNKYDRLIGGHGRYRLALYPMFAFFAIQGLAFTLSFISRAGFSKWYVRNSGYLVSGCAMFIALYYIGLRLPPVQKQFNKTTRLEQLHPVYKIGLNLLKQGATGKVFIDNFCDPSQGSFLIEFASYSGMRTVLTRVCDGAPFWAIDSSGSGRVITSQEYRQDMPTNQAMFAEFIDAYANLAQLHDTAAIRSWERIASSYDKQLMAQNKINYVIAARKIPVPHLRAIDSAGGAFLHAVDR